MLLVVSYSKKYLIIWEKRTDKNNFDTDEPQRKRYKNDEEENDNSNTRNSVHQIDYDSFPTEHTRDDFDIMIKERNEF